MLMQPLLCCGETRYWVPGKEKRKKKISLGTESFHFPKKIASNFFFAVLLEKVDSP